MPLTKQKHEIGRRYKDEAKNHGYCAARYYGPGRRILDLLHWDAQGAHDVSGISAFDREKLRLTNYMEGNP